MGSQQAPWRANDASRAAIFEMLHGRGTHAVAFKAAATSLHGLVTPEGKTERYNFTAKVWFDPPVSLRVRSHATFSGNLEIGCNETEFWLGIKPEISSYYWGRWDETMDEGVLPISPKVVREALGIIPIDDEEAWALSEGKNVLILSRSIDRDGLVKKIFLHPRKKEIVKILYEDAEGMPWVTADLVGYRGIAPNFSVPTVIRLSTWSNGKRMDSMKLTMHDFDTRGIPASVFERREPKGFENVRRVTQPMAAVDSSPD